MLKVELARTPQQQKFGLMHRESLPENEGMAFIFVQEVEGGFWMKDTLIPLSVAFFDKDGTILEIIDMEPCKQEPCKVYDPGVRYKGALEVNKGTFRRLGVNEGDVIHISQ